ncbi:MAG: ATP-binding cassette domain-containing protein [Thermaurantiacus tibetensis]|uniref:ATP-binding cassette domain-containing protein n=1 Tax=Thermaurantiacus tibetensis TaxID=2759035 RepID=UPI00188F2B27|nr:ATP-binding cassette domain-containing protein [Thermaurantiacus tibetensis]
MLEAVDLGLARAGRRVLGRLTHRFRPGEVTVLAGPNGAGKSTLLAALAGDLVPSSGRILLDGAPPHALPLEERARRRAALPQQPSVAFAFAVREVVAMGLHPHGLAPDCPPGMALVEHALAALDLAAMAARPATQVSGGEGQRIHLARVLVQAEAALAAGLLPLLLLDEPATGLDWRHQFALVRLLQGLAARGATVVLSLHDLPLARALGGEVLLLAEGGLRACGTAGEVLAPPLLARWFGLGEREARLLAA